MTLMQFIAAEAATGILSCLITFIVVRRINRFDGASAVMNNYAKMASKREYIPEMIAVGENAEVVEVDANSSMTIDNVPVRNRSGCIGCRYAGRYVVKVS